MSRARVVLSVVAMAVIGSQAGHLLTYTLRFGDAAARLQSTGAHAYFPAVIKPAFGVAAMAILGCLLAVGFARLVTGRRIEHEAAPSFLRLLAAIYTIQLACFALQETVEAMLSGAPVSSAGALVLWGMFGQLPVAVVAAIALSWLLVRLRPALVLLKARCGSALQLLRYTAALALFPIATEVARSIDGLASTLNPRGPPSS